MVFCNSAKRIGGAEYFTGLIDNFKIYDSSLAAATDAFNAISVAQEATENFSVITESNGVPIVWSSDNNAIRFTEDGTAQVTRPAVGEADAVATLTAKLNGSDDQLRTFKVTVPHIISDDEKIQSDLDAVNILDADDIRSNFVVPYGRVTMAPPYMVRQERWRCERFYRRRI